MPLPIGGFEMPERLDDFLLHRKPTADRPLQGLTVLIVEDSRFASEAMRLLCLRSGARVRRADCLASAARHLATYRPSVLVVDLGLPDGTGLTLIGDTATAEVPIPVILATSGDPGQEAAALDAGAHAFLPKPLSSLAVFQEAVLAGLPVTSRPKGPRSVSTDRVSPDRLALQDDLANVARAIAQGADARRISYIAQFVEGIGQSADDRALVDAAQALGRAGRAGRETGDALRRMAGVVESRLERRAVV